MYALWCVDCNKVWRTHISLLRHTTFPIKNRLILVQPPPWSPLILCHIRILQLLFFSAAIVCALIALTHFFGGSYRKMKIIIQLSFQMKRLRQWKFLSLFSISLSRKFEYFYSSALPQHFTINCIVVMLILPFHTVYLPINFNTFF